MKRLAAVVRNHRAVCSTKATFAQVLPTFCDGTATIDPGQRQSARWTDAAAPRTSRPEPGPPVR